MKIAESFYPAPPDPPLPPGLYGLIMKGDPVRAVLAHGMRARVALVLAIRGGFIASDGESCEL